MASQGTSNTQNIQDTADIWKGCGKCVLGFKAANHVELLLYGVTINAQYEIILLRNYVHQSIWKNTSRELTKHIILMRDKSPSYKVNFTNSILATMCQETTRTRSYRSELAPSNFHLFRPMKVHLEGQKIQIDHELKRHVLNWLRSGNKNSMLLD
jgi:hypothetical protein